MNIHYANKYKHVILVLLLSVIFHTAAFSADIWWKVELRIAVTGEYTFQADEKGFAGDYSFTAIVLGTLLEDEGDFIFVQAYEDIPTLKWQETIYINSSPRQFSRAGKIKPTTTLNYVFRRDRELAFDFEIETLEVPYKNPVINNPRKQLHLPESAGEDSVNAKTHYNRHITSGSNQVVIHLEDMYKEKESRQVFLWKWLDNKDSPSWQNHHDVEVSLKILRMSPK